MENPDSAWGQQPSQTQEHIINKAEFDHREWGVRGSVGWDED
jgi:hypothetical protein